MELGEGIKKLLLAGIGTAAVTAEKSKEVLDELVKKGELTVEQGKVLNQELKHNIKESVKKNVNVTLKPSNPDELKEVLGKMTPDQLAALKEQISKMQAKDVDAEETAEEEEEAEEVEEYLGNPESEIGKAIDSIERGAFVNATTPDQNQTPVVETVPAQNPEPEVQHVLKPSQTIRITGTPEEYQKVIEYIKVMGIGYEEV